MAVLMSCGLTDWALSMTLQQLACEFLSLIDLVFELYNLRVRGGFDRGHLINKSHILQQRLRDFVQNAQPFMKQINGIPGLYGPYNSLIYSVARVLYSAKPPARDIRTDTELARNLDILEAERVAAASVAVTSVEYFIQSPIVTSTKVPNPSILNVYSLKTGTVPMPKPQNRQEAEIELDKQFDIIKLSLFELFAAKTDLVWDIDEIQPLQEKIFKQAKSFDSNLSLYKKNFATKDPDPKYDLLVTCAETILNAGVTKLIFLRNSALKIKKPEVALNNDTQLITDMHILANLGGHRIDFRPLPPSPTSVKHKR